MSWPKKKFKEEGIETAMSLSIAIQQAQKYFNTAMLRMFQKLAEESFMGDD